jgi:2-polyprenyl-3-methyl-5-hydroxy-6-metoxy-1,4-benzoquinol methylase
MLTDADIEEDRQQYPDDQTFYRETDVYLYNGAQYYLEGWKRPYYGTLFKNTRAMGNGIHILDYGCGIGCDGLLFLDANYRVSFADVESKGLDFLRWRLWARREDADVYVLNESPEIPMHNIVWCMDVAEHLLPDEQERLLLEILPGLGEVVFVNLIDDPQAHGCVHYPIDTKGLLEKIVFYYPSMVVDKTYEKDMGKGFPGSTLVVYGKGVQ